jgi:lipid-binding SYLF domain-containing protein
MEKMNLFVGKVFLMFLSVTLVWGLGVSVINQEAGAADDKTEARQLVEKAAITFENFQTAKDMDDYRALVKKAKGIFICPQMLRGAYVVGLSGGSGLLVARDSKTGKWNGPAFYTMGGASFGLQAGGDAAQVVLLIMTDRGVSSLLASSVKLGADASISAGPVGGGVKAETVNLSADILSFTQSKGLYGGVSVEGAVVKTRNKWNSAYYGKNILPRDIIVRGDVNNPQAKKLIEMVTEAASAK